MSTILNRLLYITPATSDDDIARMIAEKLIYYTTSDAYRFRIDHSIGAPMYKPCPVAYDWRSPGGHYVGIDTPVRASAMKWLTDAAKHGYTICQVDAKHKLVAARAESIKLARSRAEAHQRYKDNPDDDIPF
jgi:hypothetical protein